MRSSLGVVALPALLALSCDGRQSIRSEKLPTSEEIAMVVSKPAASPVEPEEVRALREYNANSARYVECAAKGMKPINVRQLQKESTRDEEGNATYQKGVLCKDSTVTVDFFYSCSHEDVPSDKMLTVRVEGESSAAEYGYGYSSGSSRTTQDLSIFWGPKQAKRGDLFLVKSYHYLLNKTPCLDDPSDKACKSRSESDQVEAFTDAEKDLGQAMNKVLAEIRFTHCIP